MFEFMEFAIVFAHDINLHTLLRLTKEEKSPHLRTPTETQERRDLYKRRYTAYLEALLVPKKER
jgi:shikimate kinase